MKLREHIRKILLEEINITTLLELKRRSYLIDEAFKNNIKNIPRDKFESSEKYIKTIIHHTLMDLHGDYFVYSELPDEEWDIFKKYIINYIKSNYQFHV